MTLTSEQEQALTISVDVFLDGFKSGYSTGLADSPDADQRDVLGEAETLITDIRRDRTAMAQIRRVVLARLGGQRPPATQLYIQRGTQ